jgi:endonuclease YncB( thermonuclease family)
MSEIRKTHIRYAVGPVKHVHDGDTFVMEYLDLGWGVRIHPIDEGTPGYCSIRTTLPNGLMYDAPELKDKARSKVAVAYAKVLLPPGTMVSIVSYGFSFNRTLAAVTLPDGSDYATLMVSAGHTK